LSLNAEENKPISIKVKDAPAGSNKTAPIPEEPEKEEIEEIEEKQEKESEEVSEGQKRADFERDRLRRLLQTATRSPRRGKRTIVSFFALVILLLIILGRLFK